MNVNKVISDGGGVWLPFAISRLRALRATGLPYASQTFTMPDGITVKVEITGRLNYVYITGGASTAYMESGQYTWSYPGLLNPDRFKPADWSLIDIPSNSKWLGKIDTGKEKLGESKNDPTIPALIRGDGTIQSQAVGYPYVKPADAIKEAARAIEYGDATVLRKITMGMFPASLFTGKLRLFIQAQYGAMFAKGGFPFVPDVVGESTILLYYTTKTGERLQFGFYNSKSQGLLTASDGSFYLIDVQGSTTVTFTAYRIKLMSGSPLSARYKDKLKNGFADAEERKKLEAYIFSASVIDLANPIIIGTFTAVPGGAIAYGWKFNWDGSKASKVVHEILGTGAADYRWKASTIHATITHSFDDKGVISFALNRTISNNGEWTDGWGTYEFWAPEDVLLAAPLTLVSLKTGRTTVKPDFNFSDVEIYGYYDKNDAWCGVKITRVVDTTVYLATHTQEDTGLVYDPSVNLLSGSRYQYASRIATEAWTYKSYAGNIDTAMHLTIGSTTYPGSSKYGQHVDISQSMTAGGAPSNVGTSNFSSITTGIHNVTNLPSPPGYASFGAGSYWDSPGADRYYQTRSTFTMDNYSWTGWKSMCWCFVIPSGDCEAVYAATRTSCTVDGGIVSHQHTVSPGLTCKFGRVFAMIAGGYQYQEYTPYSDAPQTGWYGDGPAPTMTTTADPPPPTPVKVFCFNKHVANVQGVPAASYEPLFYVDYHYPYYGPGMSVYTSAGGRYKFSEGLVSPSVTSSTFVGWA